MYTCVICHHPIELDDVELNHGDGRVVCKRCWERETASEKPLPKELRQQVEAAMEGK